MILWRRLTWKASEQFGIVSSLLFGIFRSAENRLTIPAERRNQISIKIPNFVMLVISLGRFDSCRAVLLLPLNIGDSVTRWLNYFKIFGNTQVWKLAQQHNILAKLVSKICQILSKPSKICPRLKISPNLVTLIGDVHPWDQALVRRFSKRLSELYSWFNIFVWLILLFVFWICV